MSNSLSQRTVKVLHTLNASKEAFVCARNVGVNVLSMYMNT